MDSLSIHVVAYISYFPFYCRVVFYFMDSHNLFVHLPVEGHLSYFQLGAVMNKATTGIHIQFSCGHTYLLILGKFPGVGFLVTQQCYVNLIRNCQVHLYFTNRLCQLTLPPMLYKSSNCSTSSPTFTIVHLFSHFSRLSGISLF